MLNNPNIANVLSASTVQRQSGVQGVSAAQRVTSAQRMAQRQMIAQTQRVYVMQEAPRDYVRSARAAKSQNAYRQALGSAQNTDDVNQLHMNQLGGAMDDLNRSQAEESGFILKHLNKLNQTRTDFISSQQFQRLIDQEDTTALQGTEGTGKVRHVQTVQTTEQKEQETLPGQREQVESNLERMVNQRETMLSSSKYRQMSGDFAPTSTQTARSGGGQTGQSAPQDAGTPAEVVGQPAFQPMSIDVEGQETQVTPSADSAAPVRTQSEPVQVGPDPGNRHQRVQSQTQDADPSPETREPATVPQTQRQQPEQKTETANPAAATSPGVVQSAAANLGQAMVK